MPIGVFWHETPDFIDELAEYLADRKVLEIFAGRGLLAKRLNQNGVDIKATSLFSSHDGHDRGFYYPVDNLDAELAVLKHKDWADTLLISWPTVTPRALGAVKLWGEDNDIIFIGEVTDYSKGHLGGCATDEFFENTHPLKEFKSYRGNALEKACVIRYRPLQNDKPTATQPSAISILYPPFRSSIDAHGYGGQAGKSKSRHTSSTLAT